MIGPTGDYDLGAPINESDKGGLNTALLVHENQIFMFFGQNPVDWLAAPPDSIREMARMIREKAVGLEEPPPPHPGPDEHPPLPFSIWPNHVKKVVEIHFPSSHGLAFCRTSALAFVNEIESCAAELESQ